MDPFTIFIKHSCQEMNIYSLEDVAVMKCVSKEVKTELDAIYKKDEKINQLCNNTSKNLGCTDTKNLPNKSLLNRVLYLQYMVQLTRYYNDDTMKSHKKRDKLVWFLNEFTLHNSMKVFTKFTNVSIDEQTNTMNELLRYTSIDNRNMASKVISVYLAYYFISKLYKRNGSLFIKNRKTCILASNNFRLTCISKANEVTFTLKHEITLFPYTFIDKVIRLVRETSRSLTQF
jgi:hypothetical protein